MELFSTSKEYSNLYLDFAFKKGNSRPLDKSWHIPLTLDKPESEQLSALETTRVVATLEDL